MSLELDITSNQASEKRISMTGNLDSNTAPQLQEAIDNEIDSAEAEIEKEPNCLFIQARRGDPSLTSSSHFDSTCRNTHGGVSPISPD